MRKMMAVLIAVAGIAAAQVKHIQPGNSPIAQAVWAGDTLYVSGQLPSAVKPADRAAGTPADYGDTKTQATSVFDKIQAILKEQGLGMGDVVKMTVFMVGDPKMENRMDFAGLQAAYTQYFGTKDQPNKPARSAVQVAGLANAGPVLEIEVIAVKAK